MNCDRCDKRLEMTTPCSHLGCGLIVCLNCAGELSKEATQFESDVDYANLRVEARIASDRDYLEGIDPFKERKE